MVWDLNIDLHCSSQQQLLALIHVSLDSSHCSLGFAHVSGTMTGSGRDLLELVDTEYRQIQSRQTHLFKFDGKL